MVASLKETRNRCSTTHFCLDSVITIAQVLQVGGCVGLHGGEVVLQHVDHLCQLRVTPSKFPGITGWLQNRGNKTTAKKRTLKKKKKKARLSGNECLSA